MLHDWGSFSLIHHLVGGRKLACGERGVYLENEQIFGKWGMGETPLISPVGKRVIILSDIYIYIYIYIYTYMYFYAIYVHLKYFSKKYCILN